MIPRNQREVMSRPGSVTACSPAAAIPRDHHETAKIRRMDQWLTDNKSWFFWVIGFAIMVPIFILSERREWSFTRGLVASVFAGLVVVAALIGLSELLSR